MLTIQSTDEDLTIDDAADIAVHVGHVVDPVPVLGFARVIAHVNTNARQFRGWGP